jgi:hypothetical protein
MINIMEVTETNKMVEKENLDVRTITMGINLLDCAGPDLAEVNEKIYNKITTLAKDLVSTGEEIAKQLHLFLLLVLLHVRHLRIMLLLRKLLIKRLILLVLISLVVIQQLYQKV